MLGRYRHKLKPRSSNTNWTLFDNRLQSDSFINNERSRSVEQGFNWFVDLLK